MACALTFSYTAKRPHKWFLVTIYEGIPAALLSSACIACSGASWAEYLFKEQDALRHISGIVTGAAISAVPHCTTWIMVTVATAFVALSSVS